MQQMIRTKENVDPLARLRAASQAIADLNLSLYGVCRDARVSYPTVRRWLRGDNRPLLPDFHQACEKLESVIATRRDQMRARLDADVARAS